MTGVTAVSKKIGRRIKQVRKEKNITQEDLALNSGLNRAYIGYIERGERNPSLQNIARIAIALNVSLAELMKGVEPRDSR